jgi:uncharacterized protein
MYARIPIFIAEQRIESGTASLRAGVSRGITRRRCARGMCVRMDTRQIALENEILRGVVGSTAHGTAIEGSDDRYEMGVFIEPPENVCGLSAIENYIYRDQPNGVRSQPGDLDLTMYSLRKFCRLATQGNPSVIILLWLPEHITKTELGTELIGMREAFISKDSGKRFLGYLVAQKMKLKGERTHTVNRLLVGDVRQAAAP